MWEKADGVSWKAGEARLHSSHPAFLFGSFLLYDLVWATYTLSQLPHKYSFIHVFGKCVLNKSKRELTPFGYLVVSSSLEMLSHQIRWIDFEGRTLFPTHQ